MSNVTKYVRDAFKSLDLLEDTEFELDSKEDFEELDDFINADGDIPEKEVIDLEAETEDEVKDSYIGEVILECPVCHSDHFDSFEKAQDYIETYKAEHDDEEPELVFEGEACPVCGNEDGFKIVGKVAPFELEDEEEDEVEVETDDDDVEVEVKEKEEVKEALKRKARKSLKESKKLKESEDDLMTRYYNRDGLKPWRGCKSIKFKNNGSWADPDLIYKGYVFNYWDIEDALWSDFLEETGYKDSQSEDPQVEAEFNQYVCDRGPDYLDDYIDSGAPKNWHSRFESMKSSKSLGEGFERKLEPGDTIVVGGSKVTVGKILDQYFDKDYIDIEFEDEGGNYRTWKSDVDGGKVIYKESRKSRKGRKLKEATTIKGLENAKNVAEEFKNYAAYKANFKPLTIVKQGKDYFVYKEGAKESSDYVQFGSKEYIDGWLYGCVQAKMKIVEGKKLKERNLTRAERYNRDSNKIFGYKRAVNTAMKNFLIKHGVEEAEAQKLWDDDNLDIKLRELGLHDEFFGEWAKYPVEYDRFGRVTNAWLGEGSRRHNISKGKKLKESVHDGDSFEVSGLMFSLTWLDHTGDEPDEFAIVCDSIPDDYDGAPLWIGETVDENATEKEIKEKIKDWLKQNGFKADSSKQIITDYGVKDECVEKHSVKESALKKFRTIRRLKEAFKKNGGKKPGKKLTEDKGDLNKLSEEVKDIVGEVFDYTTDFDFLDIVADILLRTDDYEASAEDIDIVLEDLDSGLIYGDDQWEVLRYYFDSPGDLDSQSWDEAFIHFAEDIQRVCSAIVENKEIKSDAEEDEEDVEESFSKKSGKKLKESSKDFDDESEKKENKPMSFAEFKKHQPTEDGISTGLSDEELKKEYDEYLKDFKGGIKESIESATIETEDQVINVSSEDKEENMLDDFNPDFSNFDEAGESNGEEMIAPLSDEDVSELSGDSEEEETADDEEEVVDEFPEDEEEFEFDEVQEESFNRLVGNYLNNVYSNAKSFKLKEAKSIDGQLRITGTIDFKSGKSKDTTFIFEKVANRKSIAKNKARFVGLNETFTDKKNAYVLRVSVKDKKLVAESLRYDYPAKGKLNESVKTVKGLVK